MKPCPIEHCRNVALKGQIMCRDHWIKVPIRIRREVWRHAKENPGGVEHRGAIRDAIRALDNS